MLQESKFIHKTSLTFFYLLNDVIITELLFSKIFEGSILLILWESTLKIDRKIEKKHDKYTLLVW